MTGPGHTSSLDNGQVIVKYHTQYDTFFTGSAVYVLNQKYTKKHGIGMMDTGPAHSFGEIGRC